MQATYTFDEVRLVPVQVRVDAPVWRVSAGPLELTFTAAGRPPLGWLLRAVPAAVAASPAWASAVDPVARVLLPGVRTRGSAGGGRREWYGARDLHRIVSMHGSWDGADLGDLAPVDPPARFGFSSTPTRPSLDPRRVDRRAARLSPGGPSLRGRPAPEPWSLTIGLPAAAQACIPPSRFDTS